MGGRGRYLLVSIEVKCFPNRMQSRYEVFCLFVLSGVSMTNISSKVLIPESNFHSKLVLRKVTPAQYYFEEKYHSEICHSRDCKISYYHHCCHKFMKKSQWIGKRQIFEALMHMLTAVHHMWKDGLYWLLGRVFLRKDFQPYVSTLFGWGDVVTVVVVGDVVDYDFVPPSTSCHSSESSVLLEISAPHGGWLLCSVSGNSLPALRIVSEGIFAENRAWQEWVDASRCVDCNVDIYYRLLLLILQIVLHTTEPNISVRKKCCRIGSTYLRHSEWRLSGRRRVHDFQTSQLKMNR